MILALDPAYFSLLGIYNGLWARPVTNPLLGRGNENVNDDLIFDGLSLGLLASGLSGNDRITLMNGAITVNINGGEGSDQLFGNNGVNIINGGNGNDYIVGGDGNDILNGGGQDQGAKGDTLSYETATGAAGGRGIFLTLNASGGGTLVNAGSTNAGLDVFTGFENVVGTNFDDIIIGNAGNNILVGLSGNDTLEGGGGE